MIRKVIHNIAKLGEHYTHHRRMTTNQMQVQIEEALKLSEEKYHTLFDSIDEGFCIIEVLFDEHGKPIDYRFLEVNQAFESQTGIKNAVGKRMRDIIPTHEARWFEIYGKVALTGEPIRFENPADQLGFYYDVYAFRIGHPKQRQVAVLFKDISRRKRYESYASLLYTIALELSTTVSQQNLIEVIQRGLADFGVARGVVVILPEDKNHLQVLGSFGFDQDTQSNWHPVSLDHPTNSIAYAVREGTPLWLSQLEEIDPIEPPKSPVAEVQVTWAILPFKAPHMLNGAMVLNFDKPTEFDKIERDFLLTLTENYSQALRRNHLNDKLQELATLEERQRLSRDLHDSVQQLLFSSINLASALPRLWQKNPGQAEKTSHELAELNQAALAEIHTLLHELRSDSLTQTPFIKLLSNLSMGLKGHKRIKVDVDCEAPAELILPEEIQVAMYRIAQEALHNIAKHSHAKHVEIECAYRDDVFRLMIRDDGDGFDMNHVLGGLGLKTMRERAESVGASLEIESELGNGTRLLVVAKNV